MLQSIQTKGIAMGSLFKILFIGLLFSLGPCLIIAGILSFFGADVITFNNAYVTGLKGLITGLVMAPVFSLIFAAFTTFMVALGLWIFTRFMNLEIYIKTPEA